MKKAEFLEAIKGHRIECVFTNDCNDPQANGYPNFSGLPESVKHFNPKDLLGRLKAMVHYVEVDNPQLQYWKKRVNRMLAKEDETAIGTFGGGEVMEWLDWYERHTTLIFLGNENGR